VVVTRLMGGLGNQMFQWAAARALALRHGVEPKVDLSYLAHERPGTTPRRYELGSFVVEPAVATADDLKWVRGAPPSGLGARSRELVKSILKPRRLVLLQQRELDYDARLREAGPNVLLVGYWQSESYFEGAESQIRDDFRLREELTGSVAELAAEIGAAESVAVHVRRGDYVADPRTNAFHGTLTPAWYERALAEVAQRVEEPAAFVFSDDPAWCRAHLRLPVPMRVVDYHDPAHAPEVLRLMTLCRHHVVANSSFSWWGAWLSRSQQRVVVAPEEWFRDPAIDTSTITPRDWLRL
jgi:hypothetical protein